MVAWNGNGLIGDTTDVRAALDRVNRKAEQRATTAALAHAVQTADDAELTDPDSTRALNTHPLLKPLLPWPAGIRRGTTLAAVGSTSLLLLLLAGTMTGTGEWCAVVGMPQLGLLAASEYGIPLERLGLIPDGGPDWPTVVATLLDGMAMVAVAPPADVPAALVRSLQARARQKGSVLVFTRQVPGCDVVLQAAGRRWHGLGDGRGRLRYADLEVTATGRGKAHRPRTTAMTLPPGGKRPPIQFPPPVNLATAPEGPTNALWTRMESSPTRADPWAAFKP